VAGNRIRIICQTRQITLGNFVETRIDRALSLCFSQNDKIYYFDEII